ncbi:hypothetical protein KI387_031206, partial [Taxus chinensis]
GLVSLEGLFDKHDRFIQDKRQAEGASSSEVDQVNLGFVDQPKIVNIKKCCSSEERERFISLLKRYIDVLAWSYVDLKYFKPKDVQHSIPLKLEVKPCRKKQKVLRDYPCRNLED